MLRAWPDRGVLGNPPGHQCSARSLFRTSCLIFPETFGAAAFHRAEASALKARRRGAGREGSPSMSKPSRIDVRCSPARCCRYDTGGLGRTFRTARSVFPPAARVITVHVDELSLLKRLVAHAAGVLLRSHQAVELLVSQPVARDPVLPVRFLAGFR
jgi:hypothetical protein